MPEYSFDVAIIGAGPAGCACALSLKNAGLSVALVEKSEAGKSKICGDNLSPDVGNQLAVISPELAADFEKLASKKSYSFLRIHAPNGAFVNLDYRLNNAKAYICPRADFDRLLLEHVKKTGAAVLMFNRPVKSISQESGQFKIVTEEECISARFIVGCDGFHSVVKKTLLKPWKKSTNDAVGIRAYVKTSDKIINAGVIDFYYHRDILPGYLWVFPLSEDTLNVGSGILKKHLSEKDGNLKALTKSILKTTGIPITETEPFEAWGIPLYNGKQRISGCGFVLAGDAASLVDPFTGEGVGNAMRSGRIAADHIINAFAASDLSENFNLRYDREIYRRMGIELKTRRQLQKVFRKPGLINYVVRKASRNLEFRKMLEEAMHNETIAKRFIRPYLFYKTFFR